MCFRFDLQYQTNPSLVLPTEFYLTNVVLQVGFVESARVNIPFAATAWHSNLLENFTFRHSSFIPTCRGQIVSSQTLCKHFSSGSLSILFKTLEILVCFAVHQGAIQSWSEEHRLYIYVLLTKLRSGLMVKVPWYVWQIKPNYCQISFLICNLWS